MDVIETALPGVVIIEPRVFGDDRGYFKELYNADRYGKFGLPTTMVQDNLSFSERGVLRGLHYQHPNPQGKLVYALKGEIWDVAVDIREGSPTRGQWVGVTLSADNHRQLYIPEGFAHGFCVVSEQAMVAYKCTERYRPECDANIRWDDPELAIHWPISQPLLSPKDAVAPLLKDVAAERLPRYLTRAA